MPVGQPYGLRQPYGSALGCADGGRWGAAWRARARRLTGRCSPTVRLVVSLPVSRSALDRLGKRLAAAGAEPADEDLEQLLEVLDAYQQALDEAQQRMGRLGYQPTTRTKTTSVLVDKLRRERATLKSVQDIAGARIVCEDRLEQDAIVAVLLAEFTDSDRPIKVKDRRAEPSHGYRAVHVVVHVQGLPVEIQVRTRLQDLWAQIVERLGDRWGRGIRYGEAPQEAEQRLHLGGDATRHDLWQVVRFLSERVAEVEEGQREVRDLQERIEQSIAAAPGYLGGVELLRRVEVLHAKQAEAETQLDQQLALIARVTERV